MLQVDEGTVSTEAIVGTDAAQAQEVDDRAEGDNESDHGGVTKAVPWSTHGVAGTSRWHSQRWGPDPLQKGRRHRPTQED